MLFHSSHNFSSPNSPFSAPKLSFHFRLDFDLKTVVRYFGLYIRKCKGNDE